MNMLQIIHVSTVGGAEKHTRLITKALARRGAHVTFVYPPGPYAAQYHTLVAEGVECIEYDLKKNVFSAVRFVRSLITEKKSRSFIRICMAPIL
jgi:hypothetical protein